MNPTSNETSGLSLPAPVPEQAPPTGGVGQRQEQGPASAETGVGGAESARAEIASQTAAPSVPPPMATPAYVPPATSAMPQAQDATGLTSTLSDEDLIEKEWVERAKRIVAQTHDDPYKQTEEIAVAKNDYMQKHYNKSLKFNS